ncbi:MAG: MarR family transcriptional regulator [Myxococcota bacterium]
MPAALLDYIERVAVFYEAHGLPRIAGRILGMLLVCDPPERSAKELGDELAASKGSVSTMLRLLMTAQVVERVGKAGSRTTFYRFRANNFDTLIQTRMSEYVGFAPLADEGLALLADLGADATRTHRMRVQRAMYRFLEREFAALAERWRDQRDALIAMEEP